MDAGFDSPVAVLLAEAGDGGTVEAEEREPAEFRIEVINGTETGGFKAEEFGFLVLELSVKGGIEIGEVEVPGVLAHRNARRFGKGEPIVGAGEDRESQWFGAEEGRWETEGGRGGGIVRRRTQGLFRATKKPRFGKRIQGQ
jgi:hypothetical protein